MKHPRCKVLQWYIVGLLTMGATAFLLPQLSAVAPYFAKLHWWLQLIPAVVFMFGAVTAHLLSRKRLNWVYILGYILNSIGSGWAIGVLIDVKEIHPAITSFLTFLPAAMLGILYCALITTEKHRRNKVVSIIYFVMAALLLVGGIVIWICRIPMVGCPLVFSALYLLPFPIAVGVELDAPDEVNEIYRHLSFSGFGAFFAILFVVVLILSEGEILDGVDFDLGCNAGKRKK